MEQSHKLINFAYVNSDKDRERAALAREMAVYVNINQIDKSGMHLLNEPSLFCSTKSQLTVILDTPGGELTAFLERFTPEGKENYWGVSYIERSYPRAHDDSLLKVVREAYPNVVGDGDKENDDATEELYDNGLASVLRLHLNYVDRSFFLRADQMEECKVKTKPVL